MSYVERLNIFVPIQMQQFWPSGSDVLIWKLFNCSVGIGSIDLSAQHWKICRLQIFSIHSQYTCGIYVLKWGFKFNRKLLVKKKKNCYIPGTTRKITSLQVETLKLFRSNERSIGGTSRKVRFVNWSRWPCVLFPWPQWNLNPTAPCKGWSYLTHFARNNLSPNTYTQGVLFLSITH